MRPRFSILKPDMSLVSSEFLARRALYDLSCLFVDFFLAVNLLSLMLLSLDLELCLISSYASTSSSKLSLDSFRVISITYYSKLLSPLLMDLLFGFELPALTLSL